MNALGPVRISFRHRGGMRRRRRTVLGAAVAVAIMLVSACSSSGSGGSGDDGPTQTGTQAEQGFDLAKSGEFSFALSGQLKPFSFYQDGKLTGFDYDIGMALAKQLGLKGKAVTGPFNSLLAGLQAGRFDAIVGSMTNTPERRKQADFTTNYYESGAYLWVKKDSSVTSVKDLKSATLGVVLGSTFEAWAKTQPNVKSVKTYQSDVDAIVDVKSGRIDGAIADQLVGANAVKEANLPVKRVGPSLLDNSAAVPVRKNHTKLLDALNKAIATIKSDGTYRQISMKWFGEDISADAPGTGAPSS